MRIFLYHGVRPENDHTSPDIRNKHVPERVFLWQIQQLKRRGPILSLPDVVSALREGRSLATNASVITFDDGYANNADVAAPILRSLNVPATFFITTDFIDQRLRLWVDRFELAFSRLHGTNLVADTTERERLKKLPTDERERALADLEQQAGTQNLTAPLHRAMTWAQVRKLIEDGFEIEAHTKTHPILTRCSPEQVSEEIIGSKRRIEQECGVSCEHFAYPNGQPDDWNNATQSIVKTAFTSCCTTVSRAVRSADDVFALPRITIDTGSQKGKFLFTVSGIRTALQRIKKWI